MTDYPIVNALDAATFKQMQEDPGISPAQMDGGYVLSRPRYTRVPRRSWTFNYVDMNDTDKSTLETFYETTFGSSNAFNWTHPATGVIYNVRFSSDTKMTFSRNGYGPINRWTTGTITLQQI